MATLKSVNTSRMSNAFNLICVVRNSSFCFNNKLLSLFKSTCAFNTSNLDALPIVKRFCAVVKRWLEITIAVSIEAITCCCCTRSKYVRYTSLILVSIAACSSAFPCCSNRSSCSFLANMRIPSKIVQSNPTPYVKLIFLAPSNSLTVPSPWVCLVFNWLLLLVKLAVKIGNIPALARLLFVASILALFCAILMS